MQCPNCRLVNPDSALLCDCGYNFETQIFPGSQIQAQFPPLKQSQRTIYFLLGIGSLLLGLAVYLATWFLVFPLILPKGRYPVLIAAIPALPFAWLAWKFLNKAGVSEGSMEHVNPFRLWGIAFIIFFVVLFILASIGVFG